MSENQPNLVWGHDTPEDPEFEWECLCDNLTEFINEIDAHFWHAEVKNFGWDSRNGYKDFTAYTGRELLGQVLPRTECSFKIWVDVPNKTIKIDNAHHDKPTGGEIYTITPQEPT